MSIYVIGDLHLSFSQDKPMNVFGDNWTNHAEKIKNNWIKKVKETDYVIIPGDFSWATYLEDTKKDFEYLNDLPGNKILLKGNHDYWWTTVTKMKNFLTESNFKNIDFLYNNSYCIEDKLIVGTRGWSILDKENESKMIKRECARLELSIQSALGDLINENADIETHKKIISTLNEENIKSKELIVFLHYPPITTNSVDKIESVSIEAILKKYGIKRCYYGHLHGSSHKEAVIGERDGIHYELISADHINFDLVKI